MTATITPKKHTAKEPSIEQLAKSKARGENGHANGRGVMGDWYDEHLRNRLRELLDESPDVLLRMQPDDRKLGGELIAKNVELSEQDRTAAEMVLARGNVARNQAKGQPIAEPVQGNHNGNGHAKHETKPAKRETKAAAGETQGPVVMIELSQINRHPHNRHPSQADVKERAASMKDVGQLEPIIVRKLGNGHQILSGETRYLAAKLNGDKSIECRVRECDDAEALELVAEANAQRKDLNPIERAKLIERLCLPKDEDGAGLTKDAAALRVGLKDGSSASNLVRLLKLPKVWQERVAAGELDQSWARLLLPVMGLAPVMAELEKDWAERDKKRNEWEDNAFDSRSMLERSLHGIVRDECRRLDEKRWNGRTNATLQIDAKNPGVVKELGIVEVEMPTGKKGQTEKVAVATNVKAFDQLLKTQRETNATKEAERSGRDKPRPKHEPTAAEKKANAAKQAKMLTDRRATWRHEWLKSLISARIQDQDWQATKLLCWVLTHFNHWTVRRASWDSMMEKALRAAGGRGGDWQAVHSVSLKRFSPPAMRDYRTSQRSFELDEALAAFLKAVVLEEDRDPRQPLIPHAVLDALAADYAIDLAAEWQGLQQTDAGKERLERFFLGHQTQQLGELALELKVYPLTGATRGAIVKLLMSTIAGQTTRRLPLPKCIKPLSVPGKKRKKGN